MNIEMINEGKNEVEFKVDNLTTAEVLRVYLNQQGVELAAWRREHPSKPVLMKIKTSGKTVKKAISEAVSSIKKDADKLVSGLKN